jgi:hypothetical protein
VVSVLAMCYKRLSSAKITVPLSGWPSFLVVIVMEPLLYPLDVRILCLQFCFRRVKGNPVCSIVSSKFLDKSLQWGEKAGNRLLSCSNFQHVLIKFIAPMFRML